MKRREFFKKLGLVAAASVVLPNLPAVEAAPLVIVDPLSKFLTPKEIRAEFGCDLCEDAGCDYCTDLSHECHSACQCSLCK